jgi:hypothetical protein
MATEQYDPQTGVVSAAEKLTAEQQRALSAVELQTLLQERAHYSIE